MNIPKKFKLAGIEHTVEIKDELYDNQFGYFCDVEQKIYLARRVKIQKNYVNDSDYYEVSPELMENTFWHELFHAFQFYYNGDFSESEAQSFANLMSEYEKTKE